MYRCARPAVNTPAGRLPGILISLRVRSRPVSYTHLDVYKRQVRTHGVLGAGGKLNVVLKAKLLVHGVDEVNHAHDLVGQMCIRDRSQSILYRQTVAN